LVYLTEFKKQDVPKVIYCLIYESIYIMAFGSIGAVSYDVISNDKTAAGLGSASDRFRKMGTIAGTAMTGIGAGLTMMTDKARQMNAPLEAMAIQLGSNSAEMRELALEIGNVTFPLEEAIGSMDLLTRAGMRNTEEIGITATAFDVLGDAVGLSASQVTTIMIPAFNAFQLELKDAASYTDIFTHLQRNTTVEMSDFATMLKRIAPDVRTLGITLSESVAVMEALADKGIQGTSATLEFRTAISAADGDLGLFYEALGLTAAEVGVYTAKIEDADGITEEYANAMNTQYGFMDKLKYGVSELTLKYGAMLQPVEALGPIMAGLGPILIVVSNIHWGRVIPAVLAHTKALGGMIFSLFASGGALSAQAVGLKLATAAQWLMNTSLYACPLVWIVGAIAAVVTVLIILEKKFSIVTTAIRFLSDAIHAIIGFFGNVVDAIRGVVVDTDKLTEANQDLLVATEAVEEAERNVTTAHELAEEAAEDVIDASARLAEAQLAVADSAREVETLTEAYEELKLAMDDVEDKTENLDDLERAERHAVIGLKEARQKYTDTLADSESTSLDVEKAALRVEDAEDRLDDTRKRITKTTEELSVADTTYNELMQKNSGKTANEVKTNLDKLVADNKVGLDLIHARELELAEAKDVQTARDEDTRMYGEVLESKKKKAEEIAAEIEKIQEGEVDATESAMGRIKAIVETHWADILNIITPGGLFTAGQKAIGGFIDGIRSKSGEVGKAVNTSFKEAENQIPHSDAKEGPFSDLSKSGKSVVETFARGIESASGTVGKSFAAGVAPGNTYSGDSISIGNVSLSRDYDFPALMRDIEQYQSAKRVQRGIRTI
jgi:hypothetical protein